MPQFKEPHFFGSDMVYQHPHSFPVVKDVQAYLELFAPARGEIRLGEGSTWYLFSQRAAEEIKAFSPKANIIVMLRHPVDMLLSLHNHFVADGNEPIVDFEEALAAEPDRAAGKRIPRSAHLPQGLLYSKASAFAPQVRRYIDQFGKDAVRVILFDDFVRRTSEVYRETLEFLGVDCDFVPQFEVANAAQTPRNLPFRRVLKTYPAVRTLVGKTIPFGLRSRIGRSLSVLFPGPGNHKAKRDSAMRLRLCKQFEQGILELGELIDRDLSPWVKGKSIC